MRNTAKAGPGRVVSRSRTRWAVLLVPALAMHGCGGLFDVTNPNQLTEDDATRLSAAAAMVNGGLSTVARAWGQMMTVHSTASDELDFVGSRDAWLTLAQGNLSDPLNEFTDAAFPYVAEARWMTDEAIHNLEAFDSEGVLKDRTLLGKAYLWAAIAYVMVADQFDDFVFSDRKDAAPPIGEENMRQVYDDAVSYLDEAISIAQAEGDQALLLNAMAMRARAKFARGLWEKLNPPGSVPSDPLVADQGAVADAQALLAAASEPDWKLRFVYSSSTVDDDMGAWVNERLEMRVGDVYVVPDATGKKVGSIKLRDPIDEIPDPALEGIVDEFVTSRQYAPLTVTSAREMHLIIAEAALAQGDQPGFTQHVNAVRTLDGLTPYSGQVDARDLLEHERRVNLFFMGRRLADHYRFGDPAPTWLSNSEAMTQPGTFFPITAVERRANCYIQGTC